MTQLAFSRIPLTIPVTTHSLNILSTDLNLIHLNVFFWGWETLKSQSRVSLYCRGVLEGFYSCNLHFPGPLCIGANVVQIFAIFSNLALQLCLQHPSTSRCQTHQQPSTQKPWEFGLRNFQFYRLFWYFCGVLLRRRFLLLPTLSITPFPLSPLVDIALSIIFSSNVFWTMSKVSTLYLESFSPLVDCSCLVHNILL